VPSADRIAELLGGGVRIEDIADLGSSHSWTLHRASLSDGREVFVKAAPDRPGVFAAEAAGLRWLVGGSGAGAPPPVPQVLGDDDRMLILPWLPSGTPTAPAAERFGRELAAMHSAAPPDAYGAPWEGFIADLPLDNAPSRDWPGWYAERRLEPFLRRGAAHLGTGDRRLIERVIEKIGTLAGPPEPPSRIHGDLWSGNVLWTEAGRAMVIDPAAHGGHRETDLAMLALFGAPHLDRILAAYDEASPLADGWRARVPLHQLHPLLVHVALFGAAYRARTMEAARAALVTAS
jgi:fructosamine-3-kinase